MANHRLNDVGGTPGGLGDFLIGFAMACIGGYLLANQVTVNWNSTGCTYAPNSARFGSNPNASGTAYLYGDYAGNVTLVMPAAAGLIVVGTGTIVPVTNTLGGSKYWAWMGSGTGSETGAPHAVVDSPIESVGFGSAGCMRVLHVVRQ